MDSNKIMKDNIYQYLVNDGCSESAARQASDQGVEFFKQCNHKDPYFDCLCHAGLIWAQNFDKEYKFKRPKKSVGRPFVMGKPKSRKHPKNQQSILDL